MCCGLQHAPISIDPVVRIRMPELARVRYGGAGDRTTLVCMQYLKHWRLAIATHLLCHERSNLTHIAPGIGYESEAAFSRAFKREYGVPPGLWRRDAGSAPPSASAA
jgi:AraC-like DNA-binding protein